MKLSQIEAGSIDKNIKAIAQLTDNNDHNGSILAGLKMLGNDSQVKDLINRMEVIISKHNKLGHMPPELMGGRSAIMKKMMNLAKKRMGVKFKAFHGAF